MRQEARQPPFPPRSMPWDRRATRCGPMPVPQRSKTRGGNSSRAGRRSRLGPHAEAPYLFPIAYTSSRALAGFQRALPSFECPAAAGRRSPDSLRRLSDDGPARSPGMRLLTRNGHDWTSRFPRIAAAVNTLARRSSLLPSPRAFSAIPLPQLRVEPWTLLKND